MDRQTARDILATHRPTRWWWPPWPRRCRNCGQVWRCEAATLADATQHPPLPDEYGRKFRRGR